LVLFLGQHPPHLHRPTPVMIWESCRRVYLIKRSGSAGQATFSLSERHCCTCQMHVYLINHEKQGLQAPITRDFDQLVEGPWPVSTSCPPGALCSGASAFWREKWSEHPRFELIFSISWPKSLQQLPKFRAYSPRLSTRRCHRSGLRALKSTASHVTATCPAYRAPPPS
jgi:hypothetical protein